MIVMITMVSSTPCTGEHLNVTSPAGSGAARATLQSLGPSVNPSGFPFATMVYNLEDVVEMMLNLYIL